MRVDHFLLTRFNVRIFKDNPKANALREDVKWLQSRARVFEKFCLASVAGQECRNFTWMLYFDSRTPAAIRQQISSWKKSARNLVPVFVNGWDSSRIVPDLLKRSRAEWFLTTRLDSDDAIHRGFVGLLQRSVRPKREFLNVLRGYNLNKDRVTPVRAPTNPFVSLVEPAVPSSKSVLGVGGHGQIAGYAPVRNIESVPYWMAVYHDASLTRASGGPGRSPLTPDILRQFSL
jgi:hypothetical protein